MATRSIVRALLWRVGIVGACFVAVFALLNFVWAPSCGKFSCSYVPSWWPVASADSGSCPDAISGAMTDASWAADRLETIAKKKQTAGIFYDPDGTAHEYDSSQNDDSRQAYEVGLEIGVFDPRGPSFLVDHVEVKVAAAMRRGGLMAGVLVINKPGGPCGLNPDGTSDPASCLSVVPQLLPAGAKLVVWWPGDTGAPASKTFIGGQQ